MTKEQKLLALLVLQEYELKVKYLSERLNHLFTQRELKEVKGDLEGAKALELKIKGVAKELEELEKEGYLLAEFVKMFIFEELPELAQQAKEETKRLYREWLNS